MDRYPVSILLNTCMAMSIKSRSPVSFPSHSVFLEEVGAKSCHPSTAKLGSKASGNESRDFWTAHDIPVAPGHHCMKMSPLLLLLWFHLRLARVYTLNNIIAVHTTQEIENVWVPVTDDKLPAGYRIEKQPMLFPHRVMAYIFNDCQLDLPQAAIEKFWDDAIAGGEQHASATSRHRVPLGLYEDAAQLVTKVRIEKLLCLFCNIPIFRPKSIRFSRFLIWSCDVSLLYKNRTVNTILRWVTWSFNCLYAGTYPTSRPGNRQLEPHEIERAGTWITEKKHQFQVCELRGDWEFHKMIWHFKCSWKGGVNVGICFRCPAMARSNDPHLLYWDMDDENSTWVRGEFDTIDYISKRHPSQNICYLAIFGIICVHHQCNKIIWYFETFRAIPNNQIQFKNEALWCAWRSSTYL